MNEDAPNWSPIPFVAVSLAFKLDRLVRKESKNLPHWTEPHVGTDGEGGISFEWWRKDNCLTIYANSDGTTEIMLANHDQIGSKENATEVDVLNECKAFFSEWHYKTTTRIV